MTVNREFFRYPISEYTVFLSVSRMKKVKSLMSLHFLTPCKSWNSLWSSYPARFCESGKGIRCMWTLCYDSTVVAKTVNVQNVIRQICSADLTRFDRFLLVGPRATPTNLRKLAACAVSTRGCTVRGIRCQRKSQWTARLLTSPSQFVFVM